MPFTDYFLAPNDTIALTALPDGGPVSTDLPTLEAKNVDPVVNLANLESFLTDIPYAEVAALPRQGQPISNDPEQLIVAVTDSLRDALTTATPAALADAATRLAATPELNGADPSAVTEFLVHLAALASRTDGWHMYCYWAL